MLIAITILHTILHVMLVLTFACWSTDNYYVTGCEV